ncbi:MAG: hypothetical protein U0401_23080 [Anaerolineae bacterium]
MALQIWRIETIENVLWGTQTVVSAIAAASKRGDQADYQPGFQQGFLIAAQQVIVAFNERLLSERVEFQGDIVETLLAVQAVIIPGETNQVEGQSAAYSQGVNDGRETALICLSTFFGVNLLAPAHHLLQPQSSSWPGPWFREDINHILTSFQAVTLATINATKDSARLPNFQSGMEDALRAIAKSLGIRSLPSGTIGTNATPSRLRKDIEYTLLTVYRTQKSTTLTKAQANHAIYQLGFDTALHSVATAFGITWQ